jgi:glycosyltransferase involved in cell wall biosynthesis
MSLRSFSLTIIIPTKDRVQILEQLLDSIKQLVDIDRIRPEIVVADNDSRDETYEHVNSVGRNFPTTIRVLKVPRGASLPPSMTPSPARRLLRAQSWQALKAELPTMKMLLQSFEEVDQVITETNSLVSETDRIAALCDRYLSSEVVPAELLELDPFSWKYYSVCKEFLLTITGLRLLAHRKRKGVLSSSEHRRKEICPANLPV